MHHNNPALDLRMHAQATVLLTLLSYAVLSRAGWEEFVDQINSQLEESMKPLENLGERITQQVGEGLSHLADLGERIKEGVKETTEPLSQLEEYMHPLDHLGERITQQVDEGLSHLKDMGERIEEGVKESMEPLRIMESINSIKQGSGGTTVATFSQTGKQFIIRDGEYFQCTGAISSQDGSCSGKLVKFEFNENRDFCYASSNVTFINDWVCIRTNPSGTTGWANGRIICESSDNSPKLMMKYDDYKKLCKDVVSVQYKYFTNNKVEHVGDGLQCSKEINPQICTYFETMDIHNMGTTNVSIGSSIFITS